MLVQCLSFVQVSLGTVVHVSFFLARLALLCFVFLTIKFSWTTRCIWIPLSISQHPVLTISACVFCLFFASSSFLNLSDGLWNGWQNPPRKQHKVELIGSVPLGFVEWCSFLHQVLERPGVHLQPTDEVVHVCLTGLVVDVTVSTNKNNKTN